jgi:sec-independent protein translocase protein TatA
MNALEPWHLLIVVAVGVILFGAKRLPDSARSIGRSMRIFKAEMTDARHDAEIAPAPRPEGQ